MSSSRYESTVPQAVTLSAAQMQMIDECLVALAKSTGALNIFLTDITGQLIFFHGHIDVKHGEALAALIAGSHAASAEFIKLLGAGKPLANLSHETDDYSIFSTNVAGKLILSVAFGNEIKLGIVRVFVEQARRSLSEILDGEPAVNSDQDNVKIKLVDDDFDHLLNKELEKLEDRELTKEQ